MTLLCINFHQHRYQRLAEITIFSTISDRKQPAGIGSNYSCNGQFHHNCIALPKMEFPANRAKQDQLMHLIARGKGLIEFFLSGTYFFDYFDRILWRVLKKAWKSKEKYLGLSLRCGIPQDSPKRNN